MFDPKNPIASDPLPTDDEQLFAWTKSREQNVYYAWTQLVTPEVQIALPPTEIPLGDGVMLRIFRGSAKQELLYRISFGATMPPRFLGRPHPFDLFWSYGTEGGPSKLVKRMYMDRNVSVHSWVDKKSYLAVLRQQHYALTNFSFWSR